MDGTSGPASDPSRVLTVPNLISLIRILLIPVFFVLIVDEDTTTAGLILFACVVATDWVDGLVARRTGQVSEVGRLLDPIADRLAIAAGLIALAVRGVFPVWAAALILVRDVVVMVGGALAMTRRRVRVEVRFVGKLATFSLMVAIPAVAWSELGLPLAPAAAVLGWAAFAVGIVEYYVAAWVYARDIIRATARAA
ncbi:MAG: CDP-alcohol phosphatidyltransferase family protein [Actinomycetota bacterium]